ncbi:MAG: prolyl oligopeptidase family serine peptidase [Chitinophagaceae bacterium]
MQLRTLALVFGGLILATALQAQDLSGYQQPPTIMRDLLLAPPTPSANLDKSGRWLMLTERSSYPSLAELAEPELRIAGLRINPANFSPSRSGSVEKITLRDLSTNKDQQIQGLPAPLHAVSIQWSPDELRFAFIQLEEKRADLWVVDMASLSARKVNNAALNNLPAAGFSWAGNDQLVYRTVPANAGAMPAKPAAPNGPIIQENLGRQGASRTYQDLIRSAYDESMFEYLATSQLMVNDLKSERPIGKPAIHAGMSVSPDHQQLLVTIIRKPFSYLIPYYGFPKRVEVLPISGGPARLITELPSEEGAPIGFDDVPDGPRSHQWRDDEPATIIWVRALDKGLGRSKAAERDAVMALDLKGSGLPKELFRTRMRFSDVIWGNLENAIVMEGMFATRKTRMSLFNPSTGRLDSLYERSSNDAYSDIGRPVTAKNIQGRSLLVIRNGREMLLRSQGSSPAGDLPMLLAYDLKGGGRKILWRCQEPYYEQIVEVIDPVKPVILTSRESTNEVPNYFLHDLGGKKPKTTALTSFANPYPQLEGISKKKISYKRSDGVDLTGNLYLPKGYDPAKDGPLPVLIWAYPREYKSAADAAQVRGSKYAFTRLSWGSPIFWATQGYAVLDNAEMPIVGEGDKEPNDQFIPQLYLNAHAAIKELAVMGVGDSTRVGVGGHSYGAFMTANLLAHTKLFKAGIARSGAYNRTLTPFGFQAEERTYWQAPQVYFNMSPFSFADKVKTPILLIHGELDNNSGTFPIQSERFYNALKGHGATVRYVQLPFESHGYAARENLLHMLWEQHQWLEKYVKNAGK